MVHHWGPISVNSIDPMIHGFTLNTPIGEPLKFLNVLEISEFT